MKVQSRIWNKYWNFSRIWPILCPCNSHPCCCFFKFEVVPGTSLVVDHLDGGSFIASIGNLSVGGRPALFISEQLLRGEQGELVPSPDGSHLLFSGIRTTAHTSDENLQVFNVGSLDVLNEVVEVAVDATFP